MSEPWLDFDLDEAATYMRVKKSWVYHHIATIPHYKIAGKLYFRRDELVEYLKSRSSVAQPTRIRRRIR